MYRTTDGGTTWTAANTGLGTASVFALAIAPITPSTVYAASDGGLFKTTNAGGAWTRLDFGTVPSSKCLAVAVDLATPSTLYAVSDRL